MTCIVVIAGVLSESGLGHFIVSLRTSLLVTWYPPHHGRTWASWTHTAFMRQAVACATAVAAYGGATYAAKCEMRDLHSSASHHQGGDLAESIEPLEPMPEPMCAA